MPKSILTDPSKEASALIFGKKMQPVVMTEVCRRTGLDPATMSRRRQRPETMKLQEFALVAKATEKTDEEIVRIIRTLMR